MRIPLSFIPSLAIFALSVSRSKLYFFGDYTDFLSVAVVVALLCFALQCTTAPLDDLFMSLQKGTNTLYVPYPITFLVYDFVPSSNLLLLVGKSSDPFDRDMLVIIASSEVRHSTLLFYLSSTIMSQGTFSSIHAWVWLIPGSRTRRTQSDYKRNRLHYSHSPTQHRSHLRCNFRCL